MTQNVINLILWSDKDQRFYYAYVKLPGKVLDLSSQSWYLRIYDPFHFHLEDSVSLFQVCVGLL